MRRGSKNTHVPTSCQKVDASARLRGACNSSETSHGLLNNLHPRFARLFYFRISGTSYDTTVPSAESSTTFLCRPGRRTAVWQYRVCLRFPEELIWRRRAQPYRKSQGSVMPAIEEDDRRQQSYQLGKFEMDQSQLMGLLRKRSHQFRTSFGARTI